MPFAWFVLYKWDDHICSSIRCLLIKQSLPWWVSFLGRGSVVYLATILWNYDLVKTTTFLNIILHWLLHLLLYNYTVFHVSSTAAVGGWEGGLFPNQDRGGKQRRGVISHKDPPGGLMYSPRQAWGSRGIWAWLIIHAFPVLPSSLTWVWDTKRPDAGQAAAETRDLTRPAAVLWIRISMYEIKQQHQSMRVNKQVKNKCTTVYLDLTIF